MIQRGEEELIIEQVTSNSEHLKIDSIDKKGVQKKVYSIRFTLDDSTPVGLFLAKIEVNTNLERRKRNQNR